MRLGGQSRVVSLPEPPLSIAPRVLVSLSLLCRSCQRLVEERLPDEAWLADKVAKLAPELNDTQQ